MRADAKSQARFKSLDALRQNRLLRWIESRLRRAVRVGTGSRISRRARVDIVSGGTIRIGNNCNVHDYAMLLTYGGIIELGDNCTVNPFCVLYGHGGLRIGNGVRIATHAVIIPVNHNYEDPDRFIHQQGETALGVEIGDDVWIGAGAKVLDGVKIGKGAVVGSGAVVTKDVSAYTVVAGVPARVIKHRGESKIT